MQNYESKKQGIIKYEQYDLPNEESVKCSFIALEVTPKKIIFWMKCVISYTHAIIMVIAFTLKRCHDYLADITHRTRYSRTIQYVRTTEQNYGIQFLQWNILVFIATIISFLYNVIRSSITADFFDVTISQRSNINPKVYHTILELHMKWQTS